ncbi:MAG: hypothetical protein FWG96_04960 [Methanomassiliicoccaceae archaeon]|nr:hypothetical protein [Methanomassiliicoccaceae archaeon]
MRLKNKKGMTAMVDAMIFVVVMGLAVSAIFAFSGGEPAPDDASAVCDGIFTAKLRTNDILETEETGLVSVTDMAAFYILTGEGTIIRYIESVLGSLLRKPDSYRLDISYQGSTVSIGNGAGDAVSSSHKEYVVTYGGSITADLRIY